MDTHIGLKQKSFTNLLNTELWNQVLHETEDNMLLIQELLYSQTTYLQSEKDIMELYKLRHEIDTHS